MARGYRRKCKCCLKFFRPDPCNRRHQRYCAAPRCRRASKAASQARWLGKPANQGYFRDPWHVARVRAGRSRNSAVAGLRARVEELHREHRRALDDANALVRQMGGDPVLDGGEEGSRLSSRRNGRAGRQ